jgi:hypothetical protein
MLTNAQVALLAAAIEANGRERSSLRTTHADQFLTWLNDNTYTPQRPAPPGPLASEPEPPPGNPWPGYQDG